MPMPDADQLAAGFRPGGRRFVVLDATGSTLSLLGGALRKANAGRDVPLSVVGRSRDDLFDARRIEDTARLIAGVDGVIVLPHGGAESIPGFDRLMEAAAGVPVHIQVSAGSPESVGLARALSADFGTDAFGRRTAYLARGGEDNLARLLAYLAWDPASGAQDPGPARPMATEGIFHPHYSGPDDVEVYLDWARHRLGRGTDAPVIGLWFYRSSWLSGDLEPYEALIGEIESQGGIPLGVFHLRLADADVGNLPVAALIERYFKKDGRARVDALLSPMSFSLALVDGPGQAALASLDVPVLQLIVTGNPVAVWRDGEQAVPPIEVSVSVAQPEFDGCLIGTVVATREEGGIDPDTGASLAVRKPVADRCRHVVRWAMNWSRLRRTPPARRRIAILFHHYPPKNDRLGSAFGLDSFESVKRLCDRLADEGYGLAKRYPDGESLAFEMLDRLTNDRRYLPPGEMMARAAATIGTDTARSWHADRAERIRTEMDEKWGPVPGVTFVCDGRMLVGGLVNGNVFIGMQPPRGRMEEGDEPSVQPDGRTIHDPFLPATHHYLGYYRWLRDVFGAQAVFHIGTHGTLEWLPGKSVGLSDACYPDAAIADLPNLYPYIVSNPGEGTQAKRRSYACILDHMIPPQTSAGLSEPMQALEDLLDKIAIARVEDPPKLPLLMDRLWEEAERLHLDRDTGLDRDAAMADPDGFCRRLHGYLSEVEITSINDGLHVMGCPPGGARLHETLLALTRLPQGGGGTSGGGPSLWDAVADAFGYDGADLRDDPGGRLPSDGRTKGQVLAGFLDGLRGVFADLDRLDWTADGIARVVADRYRGSGRVAAALTFVATVVRPGLLGVTEEIDNAVRGVAGGFVPPGASGAPSRGAVDVLPTGRNFFSVDPMKIPTPEAWEVGVRLGDALVARYREDEGRYPGQIGMVLWASPTMRTRGDDVAEILYLMGVRPVWASTGRVTGVEVIPLAERAFPRIDVTVRASGLLRDSFPHVMAMIDEGVKLVAALNEPPDLNILARNVGVDREEMIRAGVPPEEADRRARFRLFSDRPGCYGAGVADLLESGKWTDPGELGDIYIHWGGYAYGADTYGRASQQDFERRLGRVDLTCKNSDTREYDIFSSDDYNSYHGGMNAAVKRASGGRAPRSFTGDSNDPRKPRVRDTAEEGRFVFRTRVLNPKWIEGMKRHGYKGAGDMSKLVDYCYQWDATSGILEDWQYAGMAETYAFDPEMRAFFGRHNPYALHNITERLLEAIGRGLWENPGADKDRLEALLLDAEGDIEDSLIGAPGARER